MARAVTLDDGADDIDGRGQRHGVVDHQCRILHVIGRMQDEAASRFDRAAEMDLDPNLRFGHIDFELFQKVRKGQGIEQLVNHKSHGPVGGMSAHKDH